MSSRYLLGLLGIVAGACKSTGSMNKTFWFPVVDVASSASVKVKIDGNTVEVIDDVISKNRITSTQSFPAGADKEGIRHCQFSIRAGKYQIDSSKDSFSLIYLTLDEQDPAITKTVEFKGSVDGPEGDDDEMFTSRVFNNVRIDRHASTMGWSQENSIQNHRSPTIKETLNPTANELYISRFCMVESSAQAR